MILTFKRATGSLFYRCLCCSFGLLLNGFIAKAQLNITNTQSAALLAARLTGKGVTVLNPVLTCDYFSAGTFKVTSSNLGLDSGILLTTGVATDASGSEPTLASSRLNGQGDPQLASLAHATTYDACRLEFDVLPNDDSLRFEYVFGSEEYNNATCGPYNDAFAFFISGPGINGQDNMALVPGTQIPVAVNSINNGVPGSQGNISNCTSMGPGAPFTGYYVDNTNGSTVAYKGFTRVLRATHAVQPCATYHLKLSIADAGNGVYDSGVFLKAGSLRTSTYEISSVSTTGIAPPVIAPGCSNALVKVKRSDKKPVSQSLHYLITGNAQAGSDYAPIADSVIIPANDSVAQFQVRALPGPINGPKSLKFYLLDPYACGLGKVVVDSTTIVLYDAPRVRVLTPDTTICAGDAITIRTAGVTGQSYSWLPEPALGATSSMPTVKPLTNMTYLVSATIPGSGCQPATDSVQISLMQGPAVSAGKDTSVCFGAMVSLKASVSPPANYTYSWILPDSAVVRDSSLNILHAGAADEGRYIIQVLGSSSICYGRDTINLNILPLPEAPKVRSPLKFCVGGEPGPLQAAGFLLNWYTQDSGGIASEFSPVPSLDAPGHYKYFVSSSQGGCESRRAAIEVSVLKCCGDEIIVPTAITPNGDGRNEFFSILKGAEGAGVNVRIYNRWGETVFRGSGMDRWDGTQNGRPVPVGTYYYLINIDCRNGSFAKKTGEVTVIR